MSEIRLTFKQLLDKYPEIKPWIIEEEVGIMPITKSINIQASVEKINKHWNKTIKQCPLEHDTF